MSHALWLVKFDEYPLELSQSKRYIPQKGYNFFSKFKDIINPRDDISLVYIASNGPYVMDRTETDLPLKDWNMTIITKHDTNDISTSIQTFQQSEAFTQIKQEFGITNMYNIPLTMKEDRIKVLSSNDITKKILSRSPKYPYPTAAYQWIGKQNIENLKQVIKFVQYQNTPFLMLNLMQIVNKREDDIYARFAGPLVWGVGGRIPIIGDATCIKDNPWTEALLVYYPSTEAFWTFWTSKNYFEISHHKDESTKDVFLQMTIPIYCHPKYAYANIPSKL